MEQQILIETLNHASSGIIQESTNDGKECWLNGVFMMSEAANRNGRTYPLNEIANACNQAQTIIKEMGGVFGELDHPSTLTVNLDRISHVITDLRMEGNNAIGRAKILPTPMGNIARTLIESGARIGVSSRGAGTVDDRGLVTDYNFVTADLVCTPSAQNALPNTIYEGLEMSSHGKEILSLSEQVQHDDKAQMYLKREIMKWLSEGLFAKR